jgi:hypothetical protein
MLFAYERLFCAKTRSLQRLGSCSARNVKRALSLGERAGEANVHVIRTVGQSSAFVITALFQGFGHRGSRIFVCSSVPRSCPLLTCQWIEPGYLDSVDFIVMVRPSALHMLSMVVSRSANVRYRTLEMSTSRTTIFSSHQRRPASTMSYRGRNSSSISLRFKRLSHRRNLRRVTVISSSRCCRAGCKAVTDCRGVIPVTARELPPAVNYLNVRDHL